MRKAAIEAVRPDRWGARHDWEQELTDEAKWRAHEAGECKPKSCDHCEKEKTNVALSDVQLLPREKTKEEK